MNIRTLRCADRWLGGGLCLLLTLCRWGARLRPAQARVRPPRRILFVKLAEQGSTVLAYPALVRATEQYGPGNVFFLAFAENRFILDAMRVIPAENVLVLRTDRLDRCLRDALAVVRRLRCLHLHAAIDLEFFSRASACLTYLSGAAVRVGLHAYSGEGPWRGHLLTHRIAFNAHLHTTDLFLAMLSAAEREATDLPALPFSPPPAFMRLNTISND